MNIICSTEKFWEVMCHPAFIRHNRNKGSIYNNIYYTTTPPEDVEGFIENKINKRIKDYFRI